MEQLPILSLSVWLPILGGLLVLALGRNRDEMARWLALVVSGVVFLITTLLLVGFDTGTAGMQFVEDRVWIPAFDIHYKLGVDGLSVLLVLLTSLSTMIAVAASWESITRQVPLYMAAFLIMNGLMIGVFSALDAVLFYVFWEAMLIPMFLIIGIWGGPNRIYATIKFFLYTFFGSVLMLVALVYLYAQAGTFDILALHDVQLSLAEQVWIFLAFLIAFAVKVPMWPVHTWLPDAHVEAPTAGSVILAAIMLKMGGYGFLRFSLPITPDASHELAWLVIAVSLVAVVYIGLVALVQEDMKKLVAYSSIAHMGFVTLGYFMFNNQGVAGGLVQMISHGFVSAALFLCIGVMYDRLHTRRISEYGGVANVMPVFAAFFMLFAMANAGLPGTSGFVGEFMVILGAFEVQPWFAVLAATTLILGAAYTLWLYKRVIFGAITSEKVEREMPPMSVREKWVFAPLAVLVLLMGLWPAPFLEIMDSSVTQLVEQVNTTKL
ncbi:NADH:ubiquinone oxidoreductase subunit M [Thiohalorhabdus denitrificans]|uniref:NADH-quinone oxidoreductase subunit M n=1 Tax=Thiohalorhabdus denitrificans TaxID=381306 RepID=A0A0N8PNI6_9GAMM|nr:NADH-quinone oxidoreductase subunit M [Thiohalorhabdus denitrificans]KPV41629.1 NADH:ubiquinone oxidoreductase subunit M [Thiohalorhabdus denitrificans]SCY56916.1 NADH dehydrogenase subunit M [Thiohalorhabdus denitrificans]